MLAIRLQRLGRKGYPVYRVAVQEAQRHPSSGRVVAYVGSYNPHTKEVKFDKDKIQVYLKNGAQPSPHVIKLLVAEKVTLPDWVKIQGKKEKKLRNPDKLRKNQPSKPAEATPAVPDEVTDTVPEETATPAVTDETSEASASTEDSTAVPDKEA